MEHEVICNGINTDIVPKYMSSLGEKDKILSSWKDST